MSNSDRGSRGGHDASHGAGAPHTTLPACGIYCTTQPVAGVPAGRLVYFHNHGDPGPGIYLPASWSGNVAQFDERGHTFQAPESDARALKPLLPEGFYRVTQSFFCCSQKCHEFEPDLLVQVGYDGAANMLVFEPEWHDGSLDFGDEGTRVEDIGAAQLAPLKLRAFESDPVDEKLPSDPRLLH